MSKSLLRKNPQRSERRKPKQDTLAPNIAAVAWLPAPDAGFVAWGRAAERAHAEFDTAWQRYYRRMGDAQLYREQEEARLRWFYTLERAYPPGFWEGMQDLLAGKTDNLEIYLAFLEADLHFFRSGYAKSEVIRGLKRLPLTEVQKRRLQNVVLRVVDKDFRREFRDYCRLARTIQSEDWLREVEARLASCDPNHALRAQWVLEACRRR
jgi:hypothetical protein